MKLSYTRSVVSRSRAAFTLIELLVVIGIIATMAAIMGVALKGDGGNSSALQSAQATVVSLLSAARGQAALTSTNAAVMVSADSTDSGAYLRTCVVAVKDDSGTWIPKGAPVTLPPGVYFLPPVTPTGDYLEAATLNFSGLKSGFSTTTVSVTGLVGTWYTIQYTPFGTVSGSASPLIVSTATPQPPGSSTPIKYTNSDNVRGLTISNYGVSTLINEKASF